MTHSESVQPLQCKTGISAVLTAMSGLGIFMEQMMNTDDTDDKDTH